MTRGFYIFLLRYSTPFFTLLLLVFVVVGCGEQANTNKEEVSDKLMISAASSLRGVFVKIAPNEVYQFAGSTELAAQIREGANVDVFASADANIVSQLYKQKLVDKPVIFATNRVVLIVPSDSSYNSIEDVNLDTDARLIIADVGVPIGEYTRKVLKQLKYEHLIQRASSHEQDAKGVVSKIMLGAADAGFAYATDVMSSSGKLRIIELPPTKLNKAIYSAAVVRSTRNRSRAEKFIKELASSAGRDALAKAGFGFP